MLITLMEQSTTGLKRIRGRLPAGTIVADKTGTLAGTVNDVGFITLPDNNGHIAIVVFVKGSEAPPRQPGNSDRRHRTAPVRLLPSFTPVRPCLPTYIQK